MSNVVNNTSLELMNEHSIDISTYNAIKNSIYPGANDLSISMALHYCKARKLDILQKPIHIVPLSVKTKDEKGEIKYENRDVIMPGIGLYRIDASRSGQYAGVSEPEFGNEVIEVLGSKKVIYPKWCKITVKKLMQNDMIIEFTAIEYWKENYATSGRNSIEPNAMWFKRPYGQLAKCTEAQALRKAFPDIVGQQVTGEEMEGKTFEGEITNKKTTLIKSDEENERDILFCKDSIDACENIDELKEVYIKLGKEYKDIIKEIVELKDIKKETLLENVKI